MASTQDSTRAECNFLTSFTINLPELYYQKDIEAHKLLKMVAESSSEVFTYIVSSVLVA